MSHQTENSNKEVEITKKSQMKILEVQSPVTEVKKKKKHNKGLNNRAELAEDSANLNTGQ